MYYNSLCLQYTSHSLFTPRSHVRTPWHLASNSPSLMLFLLTYTLYHPLSQAVFSTDESVLVPCARHHERPYIDHAHYSEGPLKLHWNKDSNRIHLEVTHQLPAMSAGKLNAPQPLCLKFFGANTLYEA